MQVIDNYNRKVLKRISAINTKELRHINVLNNMDPRTPRDVFFAKISLEWTTIHKYNLKGLLINLN